MKRGKRTNYDPQNIAQKTRDWATRTPLKPGVNSGAPERVLSRIGFLIKKKKSSYCCQKKFQMSTNSLPVNGCNDQMYSDWHIHLILVWWNFIILLRVSVKSNNFLIRITKNPNIFYTIDFWTAK